MNKKDEYVYEDTMDETDKDSKSEASSKSTKLMISLLLGFELHYITKCLALIYNIVKMQVKEGKIGILKVIKNGVCIDEYVKGSMVFNALVNSVAIHSSEVPLFVYDILTVNIHKLDKMIMMIYDTETRYVEISRYVKVTSHDQ